MIYSVIKNRVSYFVILVSVLLISPPKTISQDNTGTSDGFVRQIVTEFLSAVNSGSRNTMSDFVARNYNVTMYKKIPQDLITTINLSFYYESGGLGYELVRISPFQTKIIQAEVYNKLTGVKLQFEIPISGFTPNNIDGLISTKLLETSTKGKPLSEDEIISRVKQLTRKLAEDEVFSGVVLIAKNGKTLLKVAVGEANKSYNVPNQIDTKFNIASVGKTFTGLAIMKLVEQGKLSYDDTLNKYISSDWLNPEVSKKIQIKHLLTHTSGLGDYFKDAYNQCAIPFFRDLQDYKSLMVGNTLSFEPGTRFSYSNTGMILLGVVIENVTHEKYFSYLKKNIFEPAGMINTDGFDKDRPVNNLATGYSKMYENGDVYWDNHQFTRIMRGSPSGGIYSTVEDLLKYDIALRSNKLLSPENSKNIFIGRPELNASFHSYGFFVSEGTAGRIASHQGDGNGVNCQFKMYLDLGYTIVVLSNYSQPSANIVANVTDQLMIRFSNQK